MSKLLSQRIVSLREYKGWIQEELAENADVEPSYISKIERNKAPNVSGVILGRIANALQTSVDYLLGRTDNPSPTAVPNHPLLKDPLFHQLMARWQALETDDDRKALLFIAERMAAKVERRGK